MWRGQLETARRVEGADVYLEVFRLQVPIPLGNAGGSDAHVRFGKDVNNCSVVFLFTCAAVSGVCYVEVMRGDS